jgi:hypothetical protein
MITTSTPTHPTSDTPGGEAAALLGVLPGILSGLLAGVKRQDIRDAGGPGAVRLCSLAWLAGRGDAVLDACLKRVFVDAVNRGDPLLLGPVEDTLTRILGLPGSTPAAVLRTLAGSGSAGVPRAAGGLTGRSLLMAGTPGAPVSLARHWETITRASWSAAARGALPDSIAGVCRADLLLGYSDSDRWVLVVLRRDARRLKPAAGVRVGLVSAEHAAGEEPYWDSVLRMAVCPLSEDGFLGVFHGAWRTVQAFLAADAGTPKAWVLKGPEKHVAGILDAHRAWPVTELIRALTATQTPSLPGGERR